jgi:Mor family transcriptional regulator
MNDALLRRVATKYRNDILQPYDAIMELDGFEAICAFSEYFNGTSVYVPTKKTIFQHCLERAAYKEFDGTNFPALVRKYGLSNRTLRRVFGYN